MNFLVGQLEILVINKYGIPEPISNKIVKYPDILLSSNGGF